MRASIRCGLVTGIIVVAVAGAMAWRSRIIPATVAPPRGVPPRSAPSTSECVAEATSIAFVPNLGQWEADVRYAATMGGAGLRLHDRGWRLDLQESVEESAEAALPALAGDRREPRVRAASLGMTFTGGAGETRLVPQDRLPGADNYFLTADPVTWRTDVPRFGAVAWLGLYAGVDARIYSRDGHPEYDILLSPGADLEAVEIVVDGARSIAIDATGALELSTDAGPVRLSAPIAYERRPSGERAPIASAYEIHGPDKYGFSVPAWDGTTGLEIDPGLLYSSRFGQELFSVGIDGSGLIWVGAVWTGWIARLDPALPAGQQVVWTVQFGGVYNMFDMFVTPGGVVTATGRSSGGIPTTPGALDTTFNGVQDAFVTRFDPSRPGSAQLVWSTYLGGSGMDWGGLGVFVEESGLVSVTGATESADFPTTPGAWDTTHGGGGLFGDAFVAVLDPSRQGSEQMVYSTFIGAGGSDAGYIVRGGPILTVAGSTRSNGFPVTLGAFDTTLNGAWDAFIVRIDPSLPAAGQLRYGTLLGGGGDDYLNCRTPPSIDGAGVMTLAGETTSVDFPTTAGAWNRTHHGDGDVFVVRFDPSGLPGQQLLYSTLLGGSARDYPVGAVAAPDGVVTVTGRTLSSGFPVTTGAFQANYGGAGDGFVVRLDPSAPGPGQLVYATFLGGSSSDEPIDLAISPAGDAVVVGRTSSTNFPTTPAGSSTGSGFLAIVEMPNEAPTAVAGPDLSIHAGQTVGLDGSASFDDNTPSALLAYAWTFVSVPAGSQTTLSGAATATPVFVVDHPGTYIVQLIVTDQAALSSPPDTVTISSTNIAPTAAAGPDQAVIVGTVVTLDGTQSSDPESDPLAFAWVMTALPAGSTAFLVGEQTAVPAFVPDLIGVYVIGMMVSDGFACSQVDEVVITVITGETYAINTATEVLNTVTVLPVTSVSSTGNQHALTTFVGQAIQQIQNDNLEVARARLLMAISRMDGCALRGSPDGPGPGRDWVTDCAAQLALYADLNAALQALGGSAP